MVGARGVLTGLRTQAAREAPAFIHIVTDFAQGVVLVSCLALTAVGAWEVVADLTCSTAMRPNLTLVYINTSISLGVGMVTAATGDTRLLAVVGAHSVDAAGARATWI